MRHLDFGSWQTLLPTLLGLAFITLIGVGIRLVVMQAIQQRRARENRQINERLRSLMAAYKTLGGSFTGNLAVNPAHLRDLRRRRRDAQAAQEAIEAAPGSETREASPMEESPGAERARRVRDAVEAALSDIILLGTEEQVVLAAKAATDLSEGRPIQTAELVVSLRDFIRQALDLEPVPKNLAIPPQGPTRPGASRGKSEGGAKGRTGGSGSGGAGGTGVMLTAGIRPDQPA